MAMTLFEVEFQKVILNFQKIYVNSTATIPQLQINQKSKDKLKIADNYNISIGNVKKLVLNFFDNERYVLCYKNLQLYLRLGLKIRKKTW